MEGVARVLYRLPWVLITRRVFIVEGEKCADALWDFGIVATCNDCGAGHWRADHGLWLAGRDVVILPDNDEPGRMHGEAVAQALYGLAKTIKILELPGLGPKGDVYDWIKMRGDEI